MKQSISILTLWIRKKTIFHTKPYQTTPNHTKYVCIPSRQQPCIFPCIWVCSQPVACGDVTDPCMHGEFQIISGSSKTISSHCHAMHSRPFHAPAWSSSPNEECSTAVTAAEAEFGGLVSMVPSTCGGATPPHRRGTMFWLHECHLSHHTMHTTTCPFYGGPKAR